MRARTSALLWIIPVSLVAMMVSAGAAGLYSYTTDELSGPVQPLEFSHLVHFETLKIECLYCHDAAAKSQHAGIPAVSTCMGCHQWVKKGTSEGSEQQIAKLAEYFQRGEPIPWVRVHWMPEHVQFRHNSHVRFGLQCQDCHGAVETMNRIFLVPETQYASASAWLPAQKLEMGWCLNCHIEKAVTRNCVSCHY
jgi:hypothetical protein